MAWGRLCVCAFDLQVLHYCFLILQGQPLRDSVVAALANHEAVRFVRVERALEGEIAAGLCFRTVEVTTPTYWAAGGMLAFAGMLWEDFTNTGVPEVPRYSVTHKLGTGATSIVYCAMPQGVASGESGGADGAGGAGAGSRQGVRAYIAVKTARPGMEACLSEERVLLQRVEDFDKLRRVVRIASDVEALDNMPLSPSRGRAPKGPSSAAPAAPATLCLVPVCRHFKHYCVGGPHFSLHHALQFLEGLEAIHSAGLVHRDCRPSNIMVDPDGDLIVGDLGFAVEVR